MYVQTFPRLYFFKTNFQKDVLLEKFPEEASKWVTIKVKVQRTNRILNVSPRGRTFVRRKGDPCLSDNIWTSELLGIGQSDLRIGAYRVRVLAIVPRHASNRIYELGCCQV